MNKRIRCDIETRSVADIDVGSYNYARHPTTQVVCMAIENEDGNVRCYDLLECRNPPKEWVNAVANGWEIHAWNCAFEYENIGQVLSDWPQPHPELWRDTAAKALCCGFPASLGECAKALRLDDTKDEAGAALINFFSVPQPTGKNKGAFRNPADHPEKWQAFKDYCCQDVKTLIAIDEALPDQTQDELAFWLATWEANRSGVGVDTLLAQALITMADVGTKHLLDQLGYVEGFDKQWLLTNPKALVTWLHTQGVAIDSVAKPRIKDALKTELPDLVQRILRARQDLGKSSVNKLAGLLEKTGSDGRVHHMIRPHGTGTGRDTSVGFNLMNLPRGEKMDADALCDAALSGDAKRFLDLAVVKGHADPLGGAITCIRGCFAPSPGKVFLQADWSAVEPRIGAWLVNDERMLSTFRRIDSKGGTDIYQEEAAPFYCCLPSDVVGDMRQFGKVYTLACQYQAGETTIQRFAKDQYGIVLTEAEAKRCKEHWRSHHPLWVQHWSDVQKAAMSAIRTPGKVFRCGRSAWCYDGSHLKVKLPSGRIIWFPWAEISFDRDWPSITYMYVEQQTHRWVRGPTYGGALCNLLTQGTGACLLRATVRNLRRRGLNPVLRCYDEVVSEGMPEDKDRFMQTMVEVPPWASGLPLAAGGWIHNRYKKG